MTLEQLLMERAWMAQRIQRLEAKSAKKISRREQSDLDWLRDRKAVFDLWIDNKRVGDDEQA